MRFARFTVVFALMSVAMHVPSAYGHQDHAATVSVQDREATKVFVIRNINDRRQDPRMLWNPSRDQNAVDWNSQNDPLEVSVGDVLEIRNEDIEPHIVHTNGSPFPHGSLMEPIRPGTSVKYVITRPHDPDGQGPLYDHGYGSDPKFGQMFWIRAR